MTAWGLAAAQSVSGWGRMGVSNLDITPRETKWMSVTGMTEDLK